MSTLELLRDPWVDEYVENNRKPHLHQQVAKMDTNMPKNFYNTKK